VTRATYILLSRTNWAISWSHSTSAYCGMACHYETKTHWESTPVHPHSTSLCSMKARMCSSQCLFAMVHAFISYFVANSE